MEMKLLLIHDLNIWFVKFGRIWIVLQQTFYTA